MKYILLLAFACIYGHSQCQEASSGNIPKYLPYRQGKLWGLMDTRTRKFVLQPVYQGISRWNDKMAEVTENGKDGVIDMHGQIIIPFKYDFIYFDTLNKNKPLIQGTIGASTKWPIPTRHDQHDYYNLKGKLKFSVKGSDVGFFKQDTLTFMRTGDTIGILSNSGKYVAYRRNIPGGDTSYQQVVNNRIKFIVFSLHATGEQDIYGRITKPAVADSLTLKYMSVEKVAFNLYLVRSKRGGSGNLPEYGYGLVDSTGKVILPTEYDPYDPYLLYGKFDNGLMLMIDRKNEKCGYVDTMGRFVIPIQFKRSYPFSGNRAAFMDSATFKIGFIDKTGRIVIPPKFDMVNGLREGRTISYNVRSALRFSEGFCLMVADSDITNDDGLTKARWFYIDTVGNIKIKLPDEVMLASGFSNGLAMVVNKEHKFGFIDKTGKVVIPIKYEDKEPGGYIYFHEGVAFVYSKHGYIDKTGYEYFKD